MTAVSPDRVLRELADLWVSVGKQPEGGGAGVLRACSMTLIALTASGDDPADVGETIAALMPEHPARAIVVRLGDPEPGLSARVFSQCWMPFGQRRQICSEQVEIRASTSAIDDLAALLLPLCVPDLPVVLWVRARNAVDLPDFPKLAALARRTIVDTAGRPDPRASLTRLAAAVASGTWVGDLAWTRLTQWRETIARAFENRDRASALPGIDRVEVRHGGANVPTPALYMAAWLQDCLRAAGARPPISFIPDPAAPDGELGAVRLSGSIDLLLRCGGEVLRTGVDGIALCGRLAASTEYLRLREELAITGADPVFERTLPTAVGFAISSGVK